MHLLLSRFRLLPVTLFAASLMLTVKLGAIWNGLDTVFDTSISFSAALAQPAAEQNQATSEAGDGSATEAVPSSEMNAPDFTHASGPDRQRMTSASQMQLLDQLAERRNTLNDWEREIAQRDALLKAAETRINRKVKELRAMQASLDSLIKVYDDQQDGQIRSLVKIYENMKPKDAARIFQELDMDTLLLVAEGMKERKLAPIMAEMNPGKAKEVTVELARLRRMEQRETATKNKPGGA